MSRSEYLFPNRLTRRELLALGVAATATAATSRLLADEAKPPVKIGSGPWTYTLDETWGVLPDGMAGPIVLHDRNGKAISIRYGVMRPSTRTG